ncbi:tRNA lysidine(34) synthetase TilS [Paenibacillus nasutitermitis]|uniref:tRNA(Ile)-lysidine synthase n=1 Tax=Paenibacillus nasutitermitis TaxID=1652958 RepID=A0A917E452_9BACL|nr:tRNA lysidine(34) synthetase TilS [Paenibacillus nasutitermitis]GGD99679.1 tRNA(Ile)-lysidine synthase [Paenibacillus nasutitermitis]
MKMDEWLVELSELAAEEQLWLPGETIIVAVSGGPDSTALLHMLSRLAPAEQLTLVAAHMNHGFRGEESDREEQAVQRFAAELGVCYESVYIDMPAYIEETKMNSQAASRERRYAFLHKVAKKHSASRIALAHHADDQAETVLMRILRGTGPGGLAGIPIKRSEKNVELIRPLLRRNKADILHYCHQWGLAYSQDSSNGKRTYVRNAIRLDALPYLAQFNPQLSDALVRLSGLAASEDDWMERETQAAFERCIMISREGCQMTRKALLELHVALQRRLIKLILNHVGLETSTISFDSIETIRQAVSDRAPTTWSFDAGSGVRFVREYDSLHFVHADVMAAREQSEADYAYVIMEGMDRLELPQAKVVIMLDMLHPPCEGKSADRMESRFDAELIQWPLTVRNRRPGDRMQVLGLNGTKKVQNMFVDDRIAPSQRNTLPLLVDAEGRILWIPGVRRSRFAQVTGASQRVLRIRADFGDE